MSGWLFCTGMGWVRDGISNSDNLFYVWHDCMTGCRLQKKKVHKAMLLSWLNGCFWRITFRWDILVTGSIHAETQRHDVHQTPNLLHGYDPFRESHPVRNNNSWNTFKLFIHKEIGIKENLPFWRKLFWSIKLITKKNCQMETWNTIDKHRHTQTLNSWFCSSYHF